jgi:hypothetical protein
MRVIIFSGHYFFSNQAPFNRQRKQLMALIVASLGFMPVQPALARAVTTQAMPAELAYKNLLFHYYQNNFLTTTTLALVQQQAGDYGQKQHESQRVLAASWIALSVPDEAEKQVLRPKNRRTWLPGIDNDLVLALAEARAQRNQGTAVEKTLLHLSPVLSALQQDKKNHLLAGYYFNQAQYPQSIHAFKQISAHYPLYPYVQYNLALAQLKAKKEQDAEHSLNSLLSQPATSDEALELRDRIAVILGQFYLNTQQADKAREVFRNVRLLGTQANAALLGLGWSHFQLGQPESALKVWLELANKNASDPLVQHALLLVPTQYETLHAQQQALKGYQEALKRYNEQIKSLDRTRVYLNHHDWLNELSPQAQLSSSKEDSHALDSADLRLPNTGAAYLYQRFASNDFHQASLRYWQTEDLKRALLTGHTRLLACDEIIRSTLHQQQQLNQQSHRLFALEKATQIQTRPLDSLISTLDDKNVLLATSTEKAALKKLRHIHTELQTLPQQGPHAAEILRLKNKTTLLKNAINWTIQHAGPARLSALKHTRQDTQIMQMDLAHNQHRVAQAREALLNRTMHHYAQRSALLARELEQSLQTIERLKQEQKQTLQTLALRELDTKKQTLDQLMSLTALAMARLQDKTLPLHKSLNE